MKVHITFPLGAEEELKVHSFLKENNMLAVSSEGAILPSSAALPWRNLRHIHEALSYSSSYPLNPSLHVGTYFIHATGVVPF